MSMMGITFNVHALCFFAAHGLSGAASTRVGNELGGWGGAGRGGAGAGLCEVHLALQGRAGVCAMGCCGRGGVRCCCWPHPPAAPLHPSPITHCLCRRQPAAASVVEHPGGGADGDAFDGAFCGGLDARTVAGARRGAGVVWQRNRQRAHVLPKCWGGLLEVPAAMGRRGARSLFTAHRSAACALSDVCAAGGPFLCGRGRHPAHILCSAGAGHLTDRSGTLSGHPASVPAPGCCCACTSSLLPAWREAGPHTHARLRMQGKAQTLC